MRIPIMKAAVKLGIWLLAVLLLYVGFSVYSMTWSERLLRPVRPGMSQSDVRSLVGEPSRMVERTNGTVAWDYSTWQLLADAVVYFDTNSLVSAIETD
ncbi:MAG: outer membrane protein assembly factor BamE [Verrucomicrobiae bacterium]|nr:outer membrane protein assembly factor BamE [Verrucomicrobiae bacterium]